LDMPGLQLYWTPFITLTPKEIETYTTLLTTNTTETKHRDEMMTKEEINDTKTTN